VPLFFHVFNGHPHPDAEGTDLSGLEEARREAVQAAGKIIRDDGIKSRKNSAMEHGGHRRCRTACALTSLYRRGDERKAA